MNEQNKGPITSAVCTVLRQMTAQNSMSFYYDWMPLAINESPTTFFTCYPSEEHYVFVF